MATAVIDSKAVERLAVSMRARYRETVPLADWASAPSFLAVLLAELQRLGRIDPGLVAGELRPLVESLRARERLCDHDRRPYIQRRRWARQRGFCRPSCRARAAKLRLTRRSGVTKREKS